MDKLKASFFWNVVREHNTRILAALAVVVWSTGWVLSGNWLYLDGDLKEVLVLWLGAYPTGVATIVGLAAYKSNQDKRLAAQTPPQNQPNPH